MKNSGEAKLLLVMGAFVVLGGGALVWMNRNGGPSPLPGPAPSAPSTPAPTVWDDKKWHQVTDGARHSFGPATAPFSVVEFADFECPSCRRAFNTGIEKLEKSGRIQLTFHHYPWPYHTNAIPAALASEAADDQGKFWLMYNALFENEEAELTDTYITNLAKGIGLDMTKFDKDRSSNSTLGSRIDADKALGSSLGINSTPSIIMRENKTGKMYEADGAANFEKFLPWLEGKSPNPPSAAEIAATPSPTPSPAAGAPVKGEPGLLPSTSTSIAPAASAATPPPSPAASPAH